jgi:hypothetical protein
VLNFQKKKQFPICKKFELFIARSKKEREREEIYTWKNVLHTRRAFLDFGSSIFLCGKLDVSLARF